MQGTRIADDKTPGNPGEYAKMNLQNGEVFWNVLPPKEGLIPGILISKDVFIHEDGSISYFRRITYNANYPDMPQWRGFLIRGFWYESN